MSLCSSWLSPLEGVCWLELFNLWASFCYCRFLFAFSPAGGLASVVSVVILTLTAFKAGKFGIPAAFPSSVSCL